MGFSIWKCLKCGRLETERTAEGAGTYSHDVCESCLSPEARRLAECAKRWRLNEE